MVALATALQHVIRDQDLTNTPDSEKKGIALAFAGLPSIVDDLTGNDVLTFLRRSQRRILKEIPLLEVRDAYASVASKSGKEIPEEIALDAARKASGHPCMIQLVGYYMWRAAERRESRIIESCDVSTGESDAVLAFYEAICAPLYYGLRSPQRFFIEALLLVPNSVALLDELVVGLFQLVVLLLGGFKIRGVDALRRLLGIGFLLYFPSTFFVRLISPPSSMISRMNGGNG